MAKCLKNAKKTVADKTIEYGGTTKVTISYTVDKCLFFAHGTEDTENSDSEKCKCNYPRNVKIIETISDDFEIVAIGKPSHGSVKDVNLPTQSFTWNIGSVGNPLKETNVSLSFTIKHKGTASGSLKVNKSIVYSDNQGNTLDFGDPSITVNKCDYCIDGDKDDIVTVSTSVDNCIDTGVFEVNPFEMQTLGRLLQLNVRVKNVCPNKRLAVAVILTETEDAYGNNPIVRGVKTFLVPKQYGTQCQDVCINCINFVAPEELVADFDPYADTTTLCRKRFFSATIITHHADSDYVPCPDCAVK